MIDCKTHGAYDCRRHPGGCPVCAKDLRQSRRCRDSGIPPRHWLRTFDNFQASTKAQQHVLRLCRRYVDHFAEREDEGGGLVFCGVPGTGKTHLACAIVHAVMDRYFMDVRYTTAADFFSSLKATYQKDAESDYESVMRRYVHPALLAIDEVGVQHGTEYERNALYQIVNARYEAFVPTILISNLNREGLAELAGQRVMDRMEEGGAVVVFDWESYRPKVMTDPNLPKGNESLSAYEAACLLAHQNSYGSSFVV